MPRDLRETAQFKSDKKRVKKSGHHDWEKLRGNPGCRFSLNYGFNDIIQHVLERCLSRVAFAFEPARKAVLLVAGNKVGADQRLFYKRLIDSADTRMTQHLSDLKSVSTVLKENQRGKKT